MKLTKWVLLSPDILSSAQRERICYLKEAEGGQTSMCKIMDDTIKDVIKERDKETAKRMIAFGDSPSKISAVLDLPLSTVEQLAQSMIKA